ncbi:3-hydroxybutyrate dehydrogenase [Ferrimonas marina]|uniref:3-hydroxybutyrate dehydrogenase n=1 Tax=Ferrimonas marina TaxID=299255 RepID=A0A1M5QWQ6_9GAMM|nr:3-hydroxybutyrate dehydrogenase [Ferrimonas marina]SHH18358.1 3-hydroxybutyrate dehydrogenase [Ferrimonas marina]
MATQRTALITGAGSGIGAAVAQALAEAGHKVVLVDRDPDGITALAAQLGGVARQVDLADGEACRALIAEFTASGQGIDILVNNAGFQHVSPIETFDESAWNGILSVMLTAPFLLTKHCWPHMKAQQWGRVINLASVHGLVASPFKSAYIAAKHGLIGLTKTTALEGGECGITVNAVCPAYVRTPLVDKQIQDQAAHNNLEPEQVVAEIMLAPAAIKRLIEPEEIGQMVAYLATDNARSITGASLTMDLGWTAR